MEKYFVYIARSRKTRIYYIGYSSDPERRLKEHNAGYTKSLRKHVPLEIVKLETYNTRSEARRREIQIKRFKSGNALKDLLKS